MPNNILIEIENNGWMIEEEVFSALSDYEKSFVLAELGGIRKIDYYQNRLRAIKFNGLNCVLDAACGIGQWSMALAKINRNVEGVDINTGRLFVARELARLNSLSNCVFKYGNIENICSEDEKYDAVLCYGSLMFADIEKTMREFTRVLRRGGLIYICANDIGWYWLKAIKNKKNTMEMLRWLRTPILYLVGYDNHPAIVNKKRLEYLAKSNDLNIIHYGPEGSIRQSTEPPIYTQEWLGKPAVIECLLRRM